MIKEVGLDLKERQVKNGSRAERLKGRSRSRSPWTASKWMGSLCLQAYVASIATVQVTKQVSSAPRQRSGAAICLLVRPPHHQRLAYGLGGDQ